MIRSPSRPQWSQIGLAALAAFVLLTGAGCQDKHLGRLCEIPIDGGVETQLPTNFSINSLALECPSRICIKPVNMTGTDTTSLCSEECSSDDDCADGEKRGSEKDDPTDRRCKSGVACRTPIARIAGAQYYPCKRLCVCKDFSPPGSGDVIPESCK